MEPTTTEEAVTLPPDFFTTDTPDTVKAKFTDPDVVNFIVNYNKGLVTKKDQLLSKLSEKEGLINQLGDPEVVKTKLSQYDQFMADKAELERKAANSNKSVEAVREELAAQIAERDAELQRIKTNQVTSEKKAKLFHAMKDADIEDPELLMPHVEGRVKADIDTDGNVKISVFKADGNPLLNEKGEHGNLKDLMKEITANSKYAPFIKAKNLSGSGARGTSGNGNNGMENPFLKTSSNYSVGEQTRLYNSDKALAIQMAQAAGRDVTGW